MWIACDESQLEEVFSLVPREMIKECRPKFIKAAKQMMVQFMLVDIKPITKSMYQLLAAGVPPLSVIKALDFLFCRRQIGLGAPIIEEDIKSVLSFLKETD